jgi:hypothetical protein
MKYLRNQAFPDVGIEESQSKISDELAAVWIKNGNTNIGDVPWPGLPFVISYVVTDGPAKDTAAVS